MFVDEFQKQVQLWNVSTDSYPDYEYFLWRRSKGLIRDELNGGKLTKVAYFDDTDEDIPRHDGIAFVQTDFEFMFSEIPRFFGFAGWLTPLLTLPHFNRL